jgi:uncharacterized protein
METTTNKNLASIAHLSIFSQYCIPFGNYIIPLVIWGTKKEESDFIDFNGKQVINFQLSVFLYSLVLAIIAIPTLLITIFNTIPLTSLFDQGATIQSTLSSENLTGIVIVAIVAVILFVVLKVAEFFLIILASVKASNGEKYNYPFTIPFLK